MLRHRTLKLTSVIAVGVAAGLAAGPAYAHGFGERYDLPVPLNYFLVGAAATVALSFVVIGVFVQRQEEGFRYPTYNLLGPSGLSAVLSNGVLVGAVKTVSAALFVLVVAAALFGANKPIENLAPAFVWIIWWIGMGYVAALIGNVWTLVNPWKTIYEWVDQLTGGSSDGSDGMYPYPEGWDRWPAVALFFGFAWLENVYTGSDQPAKLGLLVILYSIITWGGMAVFGKHRWLHCGEAFSVLFGIFSKFSPTEVRVRDLRLCRSCEIKCEPSDGGCVDCYDCFERAEKGQRELNVRPYAVGLVHVGQTSTSGAVFVVLALATVTYDGFTSTPLWSNVQSTLIESLSFFGRNAVDVVNSAGLALLPSIFLAVYVAFSWGIRQLSGEQTAVWGVTRGFVYALVPIALAYNLAHFVSLLAIQGQLIIPLASDPFGSGWDLLGTADYRLNIAVVNAKFVWFLSVAAIVLGHIVSVYIAHVVSMLRISDQVMALRGQYPMLVLMVGYTATSLWIIAQPIVGEG